MGLGERLVRTVVAFVVVAAVERNTAAFVAFAVVAFAVVVVGVVAAFVAFAVVVVN